MNIRSHLLFEIGTLNTRAGYFEEVGSRLRFINSAVEPSTHMAPEHDAMIGVQKAIRTLETKINKQLLAGGALIVPEEASGDGVDTCEALYSFGSAISTLVIDLARKDNTNNIRDIAARNNMRIADGVNDKDILNLAFMLNVLDESSIELILLWVDGSTDQSRIEKVLELAMIARDVYGPEKAPFILMIGDQRKLRQSTNTSSKDFERSLILVPLRLGFDQSKEIDQAIDLIAERRVQRMIPSMLDIKQWLMKDVEYADQFSEVFIKQLSKYFPPEKNILHIDVGASSILITGRVNGSIAREKFDQLGVGIQFVKALSVIKLPALMKRGAFPSEDKVRNYIFARSLHPEYIPDRTEELSIHYEVARAMLRYAFEHFYSKYFPAKSKNHREFAIERIYLSGEIFTNAPRFHYLARLLLEGTKLPSAAEVYLDRFNIISMIGKLAKNNQEIFSMMDLKSCIPPIFYALPARSSEAEGSPVLKVRVKNEEGEDHVFEIVKGDVCRIDLSGASNVSYFPIGHTDVGLGKGIPREDTLPEEIKILLVDTREIPIELPANIDERKKNITRWQIALGDSL